jgi:hypothetical protein
LRLQPIAPAKRFVTARDWMGATIFGNAFTARASFMSYAVETEAKLAAHAAVRAGRAVLVFCGTGFEWDLSELEDFADAYAMSAGRKDGPFADMEAALAAPRLRRRSKRLSSPCAAARAPKPTCRPARARVAANFVKLVGSEV